MLYTDERSHLLRVEVLQLVRLVLDGVASQPFRDPKLVHLLPNTGGLELPSLVELRLKLLGLDASF